jgi:hypothetical protein
LDALPFDEKKRVGLPVCVGNKKDPLIFSRLADLLAKVQHDWKATISVLR